MHNSSSSHKYACSNSQYIPRLLENLKGDEYYKPLHIRTQTNYAFYQSTKKVVCLLCWRLLCTERHSTHPCHERSINNSILQSYFFQTLAFTLFSEVSQVILPVHVSKGRIVFPPSIIYACCKTGPLFSLVRLC